MSDEPWVSPVHTTKATADVSEALTDYVDALRQTLTETEARYQAEVAALTAELDRLRTWPGIMSVVDERYPVDVFPTVDDRPDRDDGPRILSLLRRLQSAEAERDRLREALDYWKGRTEAAWERGDEQGFDRISEFAEFRAERVALTAERDHLDGEIKRLADFIMAEVPGEPSQSQGAVDTAIRLIRTLAEQSAAANPYWRIRSDRHEAERDTLAAQLARAETVVRAEALKIAARGLLDDAKGHAKWTSAWDRGFVAGVEHAAHTVANSIDRPVDAYQQEVPNG
jgi:hypothetical protein